MSTLNPDDFKALEELWNLPSPEGAEPSLPVDEKARRNAQFEYCYAKRDHLEHHVGEGERMLRGVLADIEKLREEERQELGITKPSLRRRFSDRRKR